MSIPRPAALLLLLALAAAAALTLPPIAAQAEESRGGTAHDSPRAPRQQAPAAPSARPDGAKIIFF